MPWDLIKLNDGRSYESVLKHSLRYSSLSLLVLTGTKIPSIAFGTWRLGNGQTVVDIVDQAIGVGLPHIGM